MKGKVGVCALGGGGGWGFCLLVLALEINFC